MPLFTAKENLIFKDRRYEPGDILNLTNEEALDLLFGKKIDYLSEEEKQCLTAPHTI